MCVWSWSREIPKSPINREGYRGEPRELYNDYRNEKPDQCEGSATANRAHGRLVSFLIGQWRKKVSLFSMS